MNGLTNKDWEVLLASANTPEGRRRIVRFLGLKVIRIAIVWFLMGVLFGAALMAVLL